MGVPLSKIVRPRSLSASAGVGRILLAIGLALVPAFAVAQPSPRLVPIGALPSAPSAADGLPPLVPITREQLAAVAARVAAPVGRGAPRPTGLVPIAFAPASTIAALPTPASPPRPLPVQDTLRSLPVEAALPPAVSQAPAATRPSAAAQTSVVTPPPLSVATPPVILPPLPSVAAQALPPVAAPQSRVLPPVAPPPAGATAPAASAQPLPPPPPLPPLPSLSVTAQSQPLPAPTLPLPPLSVSPSPVASATALPPPLPASPTAPLPAPVPSAPPLPPLPAVGAAPPPVPAQEPAAVARSAPVTVTPPALPSPPLPAPVVPQAASVPPPAAAPASAPGAPSPVAAAPGKPADAITIGSFNIQVFGESKIAKPQVVDVLARVVRGFDVVAIQEVRAKSDGVIPQFVSAINADGSRYQYVIGPRLGRTSSKEQYVFIYDTTRIELDPSSVGTSPNPGDRLHRPPLHARFRTRANPPEAGFSFWLVDTHTDPDEVKQEVDALAQVFMEMKALRPDEDDVILLGDLNASPQQFGRIRQIPGIGWAVSGVPTNTRRNKTYDNLIFDQAATAEYTGHWGVLDLQNTFGLSLDKALEVSDHNPVWATFRPWEARQLAAADAAAAVR